MGSGSKAWVLDLGGGRRAAVGGREMVHVVVEPTLFPVPATPSYCRHVLAWSGRVLPVMDAGARLDGPTGAMAAPRLVGVMAFRATPDGPVQYGGVGLDAVPAGLTVTDEQACPLPESRSDWRPYVVACFTDPRTGPVPVLDLPRLFDRPSATALAALSPGTTRWGSRATAVLA